MSPYVWSVALLINSHSSSVSYEGLSDCASTSSEDRPASSKILDMRHDESNGFEEELADSDLMSV